MTQTVVLTYTSNQQSVLVFCALYHADSPVSFCCHNSSLAPRENLILLNVRVVS